MHWFRRRRRVDVGTYRAPEEVPQASIDEQIDDGELIALSAVRLAVTNQLVLRSLRDGLDYDARRLRLAVTRELLALAREKETDAERFRAALIGAQERAARPGAIARVRREAERLERQSVVTEGLAARLRELSADPVQLDVLAERAHASALDDFEASVVRGAAAFAEPDLDRPMSPEDRAVELRGLADDLDRLRRSRPAR